MNAYFSRLDNLYAHVDTFDLDFPDWREQERWGDTLLAAGDVSHAEDFGPSVEDWDAAAEALWSDPAEW